MEAEMHKVSSHDGIGDNYDDDFDDIEEDLPDDANEEVQIDDETGARNHPAAASGSGHGITVS